MLLQDPDPQPQERIPSPQLQPKPWGSHKEHAQGTGRCYLRGTRRHAAQRLDVPHGRRVLVLRGAPRQGGRGGHPGADRLRPYVGCKREGTEG